MTFALWIVGLPGSGKSTIRKELEKKISFQTLEMDAVRKFIVPVNPYSDENREIAYRALIVVADFLFKNKVNVVIDATAYKSAWRELAKQRIPQLKEIFVECPLETCIERESSREQGKVMADLYKKALERKKTGKQFEGLEKQPGVDLEFERGNPDLIIDSSKMNAKEASEKIYEFVKHLQ